MRSSGPLRCAGRSDGATGYSSSLAPPRTALMKPNGSDSTWTDDALASLRSDYGEFFAGWTCAVTGADGFMGSHLTDALVHLDANVHAFVRATSSGALNNIGHLWPSVKVHFADLTDRTSVDYLVKELLDAPDRPY